MKFPNPSVLILEAICALLPWTSLSSECKQIAGKSNLSKQRHCQGHLDGRSVLGQVDIASRSNPKPQLEDTSQVTKEFRDMSFPGCGLRSPEGPFNVSQRLKTLDKKLSDKKPKEPKPRIVGGEESPSYSWPWMVALFKEEIETSQKTFKCGGSLISAQYVLTAAHCFDKDFTQGKVDSSKFSVSVGLHNIEQGTEYHILSVQLPLTYEVGQFFNDISILKLSQKVTLGPEIYPVCLPSKSYQEKDMKENQKVTVTGWGTLSPASKLSNVLRQVSIPLIPLEKCIESYKKIPEFPDGKLHHLIQHGTSEDYICAGKWEGGGDSCKGDSGSPMVIQTESGRWEQLGIVSFGYKCGKAKYPGIYTPVTKHTKWIYENTDLNTRMPSTK